MHLLIFLGIFAAVAAAADKPNIVFILTDDQDVALESMTPLTKTKEFIADQGVTFANAFATTPLCCPSRSSFLTGLYQHNHKAVNNSAEGGCSSLKWQEQLEPKSYGNILHGAGYRTFYAGKYLNGYGYNNTGGTQHVPAGWDWWIGLVGNSIYYNYTLSVNGTSEEHADKPEDYLTDVVKEFSLSFLRNLGEESFLMAINPPSAHDPYTPADRHREPFSDVKAPRTANFNVPVNSTKHWLLRVTPSVLPPETIDNIDEIYRNRWRTLLAVDELVEEVILELEKQGKLDNTYVIFSSDHGFHYGQFGQSVDKRQPYEFDIRIPLLIRGPGIPINQTVLDPVLNIDFAATFSDVAGIASSPTDGESFLPKAKKQKTNFDRVFYVENHGEGEDGSRRREQEECYEDKSIRSCFPDMSCKCFDSKNNTYICIRRLSDDVDDVFCEFDDDEHFVELYDIRQDPFEFENLALFGKIQVERRDAVECYMDTRNPIGECFGL